MVEVIHLLQRRWAECHYDKLCRTYPFALAKLAPGTEGLGKLGSCGQHCERRLLEELLEDAVSQEKKAANTALDVP